MHSHLFEGAASPAAPSPITKPRRDNNSWVGVGVSVEENSKGQPVIRNSYQHVSKRPSAEQILFDELKKPVSATLATIYPIGADDDNDPFSFSVIDPTPIVSDFPDTFDKPRIDRDSRDFSQEPVNIEKSKSPEAVPITLAKITEKAESPTKRMLSDELANTEEKKITSDSNLKKKPTDQNAKNKDVEKVPLQDPTALASPRLQKTKSRSSFLGFLKKKEGSTEELSSSKGDLKEQDRKHRSYFFAKKTSSSNMLDDSKQVIGSTADLKEGTGEPSKHGKHRSFFAKKTSSSNLLDDSKQVVGSTNDLKDVQDGVFKEKDKHRSFFFVKRTSTANMLEDQKHAEIPNAPPPPPPTLLKELGVEPKIEKLKPEIELNKKIATLENTVKVLQEVVDRLTKENDALKKKLEEKIE
ncbi:hypothetical protein HDV01_005813 [Terramyces sp. JEL0728]|nr:hypothetical protein HDV01_005813 [Terramyces sp. JEL0728]